MNPNKSSWKSGMVSAVASVARSRKIWRNSLRKMAMNEERTAFTSRPRLCGALRQGDEDVLERRSNGADADAVKPGVRELRDELVVGDAPLDHRVDRLAEDGGRGAEGLGL